ncbi:hypothetical protein FOMG_16830 [Fusarium oxysporum f. sp. melonis 26406]|uniref:Uncharacterized protein n=1 Tax=Fusarium oxysporum f. sp. melonis 26406 TaxID=1089452 RepID=W9Z485_FUSOX|nr:hypothetical protein FOMG_16830 [Fusarium oxysporum f. sp. melonis 26406]
MAPSKQSNDLQAQYPTPPRCIALVWKRYNHEIILFANGDQA